MSLYLYIVSVAWYGSSKSYFPYLSHNNSLGSLIVRCGAMLQVHDRFMACLESPSLSQLSGQSSLNTTHNCRVNLFCSGHNIIIFCMDTWSVCSLQRETSETWMKTLPGEVENTDCFSRDIRGGASGWRD